MRNSLLVIAIVTVGTTCPVLASADNALLPGQRFRPALAAGMGEVYSAAPPAAGASALQLWLLYAPTTDIDGSGIRRLRHRTDVEITAATAATERVVIGLAARGTVYQRRETASAAGTPALSRTGLGDARVTALFNVWAGDGGGAVAFVGTVGFAPGRRDDHRADAFLWASPELALSWQIGFVELAANAGVLLRPAVGTDALDNEVTYRGGARFAGLGFGLPLDAAATVGGSTLLSEPWESVQQGPLEWLALLDAPIGKSAWSVTAAVGGGLVTARATPDLRVLLSLGYGLVPAPEVVEAPVVEPAPPEPVPPEPAPAVPPVAPPDDVDVDSDGDGIVNQLDGAPYEAEDFDGVEDDDGIPE